MAPRQIADMSFCPGMDSAIERFSAADRQTQMVASRDREPVLQDESSLLNPAGAHLTCLCASAPGGKADGIKDATCPMVVRGHTRW